MAKSQPCLAGKRSSALTLNHDSNVWRGTDTALFRDATRQKVRLLPNQGGATVELLLTGGGDRIALLHRDDGAGFIKAWHRRDA